MIEKSKLLNDVRTAIRQIEARRAVANREAKNELRRRFGVQVTKRKKKDGA